VSAGRGYPVNVGEGPATTTGSKAREVLMTTEELELVLASSS